MNKDTKELKETVKSILPPEECIKALNDCDDIRKLDSKTYFRLLMVLSPQKRTSYIEKRLRLTFGWLTVDAKKERGDYIDPENKYFELKTSCPNSNNKILMGQVRIWQPVDYYLILYIDCYDLNNSQAFILDKDEMIEEALLHGTESHKTKASSEGDRRRELTLSINANKSSSDNMEWTKKYGKLDIIEKIINS